MATFGDLNPGATAIQTPPANNKAVSKYTLDRVGVVDALRITFAGIASGNAKAIIYDNTGSAGLPGALKATSLATAGVAFTFSPGVSLSAGDYWLGIIADSQGISNCVALTSGIAYNANAYASGPTNPFGASPNLANFRYPVNAGYTPTLPAGTYLGELRGGENKVIYYANALTVIPVAASASGTVSKLTTFIDNTYAGAKIKGIIYDATGAGGLPGALVGTTNELVGPVINGNDLMFASPISLIGGSTYYIGFLSDTEMSAYTRVASYHGYYTNYSYTAGPPATFPTSPAPSTTNNVGAFWATFAGALGIPSRLATIVG